MGHSFWSDEAYQERQHYRQATRQSAFTYDQQVRNSGVVAVHPQMNPLHKIRESRVSLAHPTALPIAVIFDVTGSMGNVPRVLQTKLGALMRVLLEKGYAAHPQILFGGVGDAYCDRVPLQIGQFEAGLELDDELGKIFLEGGGGGQVHESYELALYFMARHTALDCLEQHGRKGYLFTIGDEKPYPVVRASHVRTHIGDQLGRDLATAQIITELQQRFDYFHIIPTNTAHGGSPEVQACWRGLLGERVLLLDDEAAVCETLALSVGLGEGTVVSLEHGAADLVEAGAQSSAAAVAALRPYLAAHPSGPARHHAWGDLI